MTRIEEIEHLLSDWKADSKWAYDDGDFEYEKLAMDRAIALESALAILKRPSNTQLKIGGLNVCLGKHNCPKAKNGSCDGLNS